jgi:hypothetical protein
MTRACVYCGETDPAVLTDNLTLDGDEQTFCAPWCTTSEGERL